MRGRTALAIASAVFIFVAYQHRDADQVHYTGPASFFGTPLGRWVTAHLPDTTQLCWTWRADGSPHCLGTSPHH